jgi:hypothetical protein
MSAKPAIHPQMSADPCRAAGRPARHRASLLGYSVIPFTRLAHWRECLTYTLLASLRLNWLPLDRVKSRSASSHKRPGSRSPPLAFSTILHASRSRAASASRLDVKYIPDFWRDRQASSYAADNMMTVSESKDPSPSTVCRYRYMIRPVRKAPQRRRI